ncbi:MAG: ISL3 family transposase [Deltaproteobacteria bacterium]|nr:ISL3 family transposase [Deltaproteobacteria bacterium]
MSNMSIREYFPFSRVNITKQSVLVEDKLAMIYMEPDNRFTPICHICGTRAARVHSRDVRTIRDLSLALVVIRLVCWFRTVYCAQCDSFVVEDLEFVRPYQRVTRRLSKYIHELCKVMTVLDVADHLNLDWKTIKNIDKDFLEKEYGDTDYSGLKILAVDEIAIRKGHNYMTVVLDYETGRVIWMAEGRSSDTLKAFFRGMSKDQIQELEAVAMDMWDPYIKAVQEEAPHVKIVFDLFHVVAAFSRVIDKVRMEEYRRASQEDKDVFKGAKYLLLKNRSRLNRDEKTHLSKLLSLNQNLFILAILKEKLKTLWKFKKRGWARKALTAWCAIASLLENRTVNTFIKRLKKYAYGIINHCQYPIHTSRLEGVNNKIKVIKRKAYGFHDNRYFTLKVKQAFDN